MSGSSKYVADQENPPSDVRSRRPLRSAQVQVEEIEGDPGCDIIVY